MGGLMNRLGDVDVTGASAQVAFEAMRDVGIGGLGAGAQQAHRGHDHARRAVAALQGVALGKGFLNRMGWPAWLRQAFDAGDVRTVCLQGQHGAGLDRIAVKQDRAAAALAGVATHMGASEAELLSQDVDQQSPLVDLQAMGLTIDRDV